MLLRKAVTYQGVVSVLRRDGQLLENPAAWMPDRKSAKKRGFPPFFRRSVINFAPFA
jgi:hypothetical protein